MDKKDIRGKRRARRMALQALYQWLLTAQELYEIEAQFHTINNMEKVDVDYFRKIFRGVAAENEVLENAFTPFLDRKPQDLNPIERICLWVGAYELMRCLETPYRVALDEAVTMTKEFGSQDGHRYVNGVLNNLAREVRALEIKHDE